MLNKSDAVPIVNDSAPPGGARNLLWDAVGIWIAESKQTVSYPHDGNQNCQAIENDSFWFRHRNEVIADALRRFPPPGVLFDVGGGNGFVAARIEQEGFKTVVVEPGRAGAVHARSRRLTSVVCATIQAAGFPPESLPAVGLFDVLEHIQDQLEFLASICSLLLPDGRLYLTVPAYQFLWSSEDTYAGHFRRYTRASLANALQSAGFEVEFSTYFFWFLPLPVLMLRTAPSLLGWRGNPTSQSVRRDHVAGGGLASWLLEKGLQWEQRYLTRGGALPFGGSCLAVARRRAPKPAIG